MLIAFWSPQSGQAATTTNLLSIGLSAALHYKLRVLLASTQSSEDNLRAYLLPEYRREATAQRRASHDLMRLARNGLLQAQSIANYTTPILKSSMLDVLAGISLDEKNLAEVDVFKAILEMAQSTYDLVLLDVDNGFAKHYVEAVLKFSDQVVVNISQNINLIEAFAASCEARTDDLFASLFICIGNYEAASKLTIRQIGKRFASKNVIAIPRHVALIDALNSGNLLELFGRHYYKGKLAKADDFFRVVSHSSHQLLKAKQLIE